MTREDPLTPVERETRRRRRWIRGIVLLLLAGLLYWLVAVNQYVVAQKDDEAHFLHGSIGAETATGLPTWVFKALPVLYADRMGGEGWAHFGLLQDEGDDIPVGFSRRVVMGVERVWFNCSVCHVGTYRLPGSSEQHRIPGAPSNNLRLDALIGFLIEVGRDPSFTADRLMAGIREAGGDLWWPERLVYRHLAYPRVRAALADVGRRLDFIHRQAEWGPGRVDTFNPYKAIQFNFPMDEAHLAAAALDGSSDFPAIWQQRPREGMNLHWDGNNDSVAERNLSAALGAGVTPVTVDREAIRRIERWMWDLPAPAWPGPVDMEKARRGAGIYAEYCAACHGQGLRVAPAAAHGRTAFHEPSAAHPPAVARRHGKYAAHAAAGGPPADRAAAITLAQAAIPADAPAPYSRAGAAGTAARPQAPAPAYLPAARGEPAYDYDRRRHPGLGHVVPLAEIGTDPGRWASYTREFAAAQNLLYAGRPWRFHRFHKTEGYASQPLDGIWARSPYLHNGSVPTLRDLLEPAARRPRVWQRGSDELDLSRVGYRHDAAAPGRLFRYDTARPGNSNAGHDGRAYGTALSPGEKDDLVEYMKTL